MTELDEFRAAVRDWCREHVPAGWREAQTGASDEEFVRLPAGLVRSELRQAGYAVPHWPREWGGGMSVGRAGRAVLRSWPRTTPPGWSWPSSRIHHAAATLLAAAPTSSATATCRRSSTVRSGCRASPSPRPDPTWPALRTTARRRGRRVRASTGRSCGPAAPCTPTGACCWPAPTPARPKRRGISYFLLDMRIPGHRRPADPPGHRRGALLRDLPRRRRGPGRQPRRSRERGLAGGPADAGRRARHDHARAGRAARPTPGSAGWSRPAAARARRRRPSTTTPWPTGWPGSRPRSTACGRCAAGLVERHEAGAAGPADASIVKLYYSELLQRMTDFGTEVAGLAAPRRARASPRRAAGSRAPGCWTSSARGSGRSRAAPARSSAPSSASAGSACPGSRWWADGFDEIHDELRAVARDAARRKAPPGARPTAALAGPGWLGLEVPERAGRRGTPPSPRPPSS